MHTEGLSVVLTGGHTVTASAFVFVCDVSIFFLKKCDDLWEILMQIGMTFGGLCARTPERRLKGGTQFLTSHRSATKWLATRFCFLSQRPRRTQIVLT
ncbi:unnamed protein product [Amoebophrya sp. A25]|nr:unnamed protein product [Amoebophrya sp. A25]|eukprot:GSA25T00015067001.1